MKRRTMAKKLSTKESDDINHRFQTHVEIYKTQPSVMLLARREELQMMIDAITYVLVDRSDDKPTSYYAVSDTQIPQ